MSNSASDPASESARTESKKSKFTQRWKWDKTARHYNFLQWLGRTLIKLLTRRVYIEGMEHVPSTGPLIVMINHISIADPVLPLMLVPRKITPMPKVEAFENPLTRWMVIGYGAIPVHRGSVDTQAIRAACEVLESGGAIIISPEGTRSPTHALIHGQPGMAFIVNRCKVDVQILPVALLDTDQLVPLWKRLRRPDVHMKIGAPFVLQKPTSGKADLNAMTDEAMRHLLPLLPPNMHGVYADKANE